MGTTIIDLSTLDWPCPVQRVQLLADSGIDVIPPQYVHPDLDPPILLSPLTPTSLPTHELNSEALQIPVIDLSKLGHVDIEQRCLTLKEIEHACDNWGFFQIINHGVPEALINKVKLLARQFFDMPLHEKEAYANNPITYEGYGSRRGVKKEAILDWGDYFIIHSFPVNVRDMSKWPTKPTLWRETMEEYSKHMKKLSQILLETISTTLGLNPETIEEAIGGDERRILSTRINFYPPCPQPQLTLGMAPHTDTGGLAILLQEDQVNGLQVDYEGKWIYVKPIPGAFVVNIGDQIKILTNGRYKSVKHRAAVNCELSRLSIATFCNPNNESVIGPLKELVGENDKPQYIPKSFGEYSLFLNTVGINYKEYINSIKSP